MAARRCSRERRFRAMGTDAHIVVVGGGPSLLDGAVARVAELERRWSRFLPDSEISRANALSGRPLEVSAETVRLVACAVSGWRLTSGRFDPTVLPALCDAGYDRDFRAAARRASAHTPPPARPAP